LNIEKEIVDAKYIVLIRNPIEMAYSLHAQQLYSGNEYIDDFLLAWRMSPMRRRGEAVNFFCRDPKLLDYQKICLLGEQIKRVLDIIDRDRLLVLSLDELAEKPREQYIKTVKFLGLKDDGRMDFPPQNISKRRRSKLLRYLLKIMIMIKDRYNLPRMSIPSRIFRGIDRMNSKPCYKKRLAPSVREELLRFYEDDIKLLEKILGRSFDQWKKI
jgi:hypothetical protein